MALPSRRFGERQKGKAAEVFGPQEMPGVGLRFPGETKGSSPRLVPLIGIRIISELVEKMFELVFFTKTSDFTALDGGSLGS